MILLKEYPIMAVQEITATAVAVNMDRYFMTIRLNDVGPGGKLVPKLDIKLPVEVAQQVMMVMRKYLRLYEESQGAIAISAEWMLQSGIKPDDV